MRVSLLGPVLAQVGDRSVDLGATKQRAVFALLAMSPGRVVSMDRLIDDLWHEEPPARATVTLRAYVSRLRRALERAAEESGEDVPQILTQPPGWVLTLAPEDVDLALFLDRVRRAQDLVQDASDDRPGTWERAADELEAALDLWRGEVLADLHTLEIARTEAVRIEDARLDAIELLLEVRLRLGRHEAVVAAARSLVAEQPFRERAWAALVLALYRTGRQSDALAAVAELRTRLGDELGLDPSPQVQDLSRRVLQQDPTLLLHDTRAAAPAAAGHGEADPPPAPAEDRHVVGAEATLRALQQVVADARAGRGRLLVLEAEAGGGKSTMLAELARRAEAAGGFVVRGAGGGAGAMPALWAWVTVVRVLAEAEPHAATESGDVATAITLMGAPDRPADVPQELMLSRTALYRGVVELLARAHERAPLTVVVDDLQWVDDETLTLLTLAVDELAPRGVVFAVAVRTDETDAERVLGVLTRGSGRWLLRHRLDGLDERAVTRLCESIAGTPVGPELATAVRTATAGNPMFVTELVRLLAAENRLDVESVTTTVPDRVHDVLERRFGRLPGPVLGLMRVAALGRAPVDLEVLAAVLGQDADTVLDDAEPAVIAGLLVESEHGYSPSHDLVRQALLRELTRTRRLRLHARLAAALQSRGALGPTEVLEVAHHLTEAAPAIGPAAAIPYLVSASEDAMSRYATVTARRILEEALALAAAIADPAARELEEHRVGGLLLINRGYAGSEPDLPDIRRPPPLPVDVSSAMSWIGTMTMAMATGRFATVRATAEEVRAQRLPPVGRLAATLLVGTSSFALGDYGRARRACEDLAALCDDGADDGLTGLFDSQPDVASGHLALLDYAEGEEAAAVERMQRATRREGMSRTGQVNLALYDALLQSARGAAEETRRITDDICRLAPQLEFPVFVVHGRVMGAWAAAILDPDLDPDPGPLHRALAAYHDTGLVIFETTYQLLLAEVLLRTGDLDGARRAVGRSRSLTSRTGEVPLGRRLRAVADRVLTASTST